jgi:hypothetical protein
MSKKDGEIDISNADTRPVVLLNSFFPIKKTSSTLRDEKMGFASQGALIHVQGAKIRGHPGGIMEKSLPFEDAINADVKNC